MTGAGGGSGISGNNLGVVAQSGGQITAGDIGSVTVTGWGGNILGTGAGNQGVWITGTNSRITSSGGEISVTGTGGGGTSSFGIQVASGGGIVGMTGAPTVALTADAMDLASTVSVQAGANRVVLLPKTPGTLINLGGADVLSGSPMILGLSDAELDRITAGTLRIGNGSSAAITVSSAISPAGTNTLHLVSGAGVSQTAGITVANLAVQASGTVSLSNSSNDADTVAIRTTAGHLSYRDSNGFTVGEVSGVAGVSSIGGSPALVSTTGDIVVASTSAANDLEGGAGFSINVALFGSGATFRVADGAHVGGGGAQITADRVDMAGTLFANATLTFQPITAGQLIDLGSMTDALPNTLALSDAELDRISAGFLKIGSSLAGDITISQPISPAGTSTLHLVSGSEITQGADGSVAVSQLALEAIGSVTFDGYEADQRFNQVTTLAGKATGLGSGFYFTNKGGLTIGTVGTLTGVSANGGGIQIVTHSPLAIDAVITENGGGDIQLIATNDVGSDDHLTINASVQSLGGTGSIELVAGDDLVIQGDSTTTISASAGTITATAGGSTTLQGDVQLINAEGPVRFTTADVIIHGTQLDDTIRVVQGPENGEIEAFVNGVSRGIYRPTGRMIVYGGDGNDNIEVEDNITIPTWLSGGNGNDRLKGGSGNNVLVGGDGDDHLIGGRSRDLLIGGNGADRLVGGKDDDILIGGSTNIDHDRDALQAVLAVWTSEDSYQYRVAAIASLLVVTDDAEHDKLTGAAGRDLFFDGLGDDLTDVKAKGTLAEEVA